MNPTPPAPARRPLPLQATDLRGLARLATAGVLGVTDIAEALHHSIASGSAPLGRAPAGRTSGITGFVYRSVRGGTRLVGLGLDAALRHVPAAADTPRQPAREAWLAVLNGVWGDHLDETANPLAIPMTLRRADAGAPAGGRILVLLHGLCMNDLQWRRQGHDHGELLARSGGWTPIYLHYNSGRHVSHNGRELAARLERLVAEWPVPVQELALLGHSMGGLVARSACHQAEGQAWRRHLSRLVCLGTPHQGAPLERGGRLVDGLLGISPYSAPFARLGMARSAGITDLRWGNVQCADWQARGRHAQRAEDRRLTPLPAGVESYVVAATRSDTAQGLGSQLLGDGLVPLASALGEHRDPARALGVPEGQRLVITGANHWDLLNRPEVAAQLQAWLA